MDKIKKTILLTNIFEKSDKVNGYDSNGNKEAVTIAHALCDIEDSFEKIYRKHIDTLLAEGIDQQQIENILFEIGEELRHILYHIYDMKYFEYLQSHIDKKDESNN